MAQPGAVEPRPRQRQHVVRQIEAEAAFEIGTKQFEHTAGAGAEIEERTERPVGKRRADRLLDRRRRRREACGCGPTLRRGARNSLAQPRPARHGRRSAARGRASTVGSVGSSRPISSRASAALPLRSPSRKNAHEPSRNRSTRPASAKSLRCREIRGCDWRKMSVRSETVSSASAKSARMRSRVASPAALSAPWRSENGSWKGWTMAPLA